uniref:Uncharacterized protein n=1 Tax=Anguilla anguilla TaxID=7936 RepID=A0A0E9W2A3_ANGAN
MEDCPLLTHKSNFHQEPAFLKITGSDYPQANDFQET